MVSAKDKKSAPKRGEFTATILGQRDLGSEHKSIMLQLEGPAATCFAACKAGQFVQIACRDLDDHRLAMPLLRRPFSVAGLNTNFGRRESLVPADPAGIDKLSVEIIYRTLGPGSRWLAHRVKGEKIDFLGPLGNGFTLPAKPARTILVGGGVGIPPMFLLADQLERAGCREIVGFAAARKAELLTCRLLPEKYDAKQPLQPQSVIEEFNRSHTGAIIATDDGSLGYNGFVSAALERFLTERPEWGSARIYACGPPTMLRALAQIAEGRGMDCQVCMESYMACGIGLCQSCVISMKSENPTGRVYKLACTNGPVFDAKTVIWE